MSDELPDSINIYNGCGGCRGMGRHHSTCPRTVAWRWKTAYDIADELGDLIGAHDTDLANMAYALAGQLKKRWREELDARTGLIDAMSRIGRLSSERK